MSDQIDTARELALLAELVIEPFDTLVIPSNPVEGLVIEPIGTLVIEPFDTLVIPKNPVEGLVIEPIADLEGLVIRIG